MTQYTQTTITARTFSGGTITQTRCQYRQPGEQCRRPAGHRDDRPAGTYPAPGGHVMRWGADPE